MIKLENHPVILFFIIFAILVGIVACSSEAVPKSPPQTGVELADRLSMLPAHMRVKLLFVLTAKRAVVEKKEDHYELSLFKSDGDKIVAFTDRPQRLAFDVSLPMFSAIWDGGQDSFEKVPPNAVLVENNRRISITELTKLHEDETRVVFRMNNSAYHNIDYATNGGAFGYPVLFIDASIFTTAGLAFALRTGAKACAEVECWWALAGG